MERPNVDSMIKEAVDNLNGIISFVDIRNYINNKWDNVNQLIISDKILQEILLQYAQMDFSNETEISESESD